MQANREEPKSCEMVKEELWRSDVLTEWERTCSPPQSEEVCLLKL